MKLQKMMVEKKISGVLFNLSEVYRLEEKAGIMGMFLSKSDEKYLCYLLRNKEGWGSELESLNDELRQLNSKTCKYRIPMGSDAVVRPTSYRVESISYGTDRCGRRLKARVEALFNRIGRVLPTEPCDFEICTGCGRF